MQHIIEGESAKEKVYRWTLKKSNLEANSVILEVTDGYGVYIAVRINPSGYIERFYGIPPEFGLPVDADGRVKLIE